MFFGIIIETVRISRRSYTIYIISVESIIYIDRKGMILPPQINIGLLGCLFICKNEYQHLKTHRNTTEKYIFVFIF